MMKKKYKIICIDNKPIIGGNGKIQSLTVGKIYETCDRPGYDVCVINDKGIELYYSYHRFEEITEQKYREMQIIKIFDK